MGPAGLGDQWGPGALPRYGPSLGDEVSEEPKQFAETVLFTDFDCRNDQNWKISHNSPPDSFPLCFMGLSDILGLNAIEVPRHIGVFINPIIVIIIIIIIIGPCLASLLDTPVAGC